MLLVDPAHLSVSLGKNVLECNRGINTFSSRGVEHGSNINVKPNLPTATLKCNQVGLTT